MEKIKKVLAEVFQIRENEILDDSSMQTIDQWDSLTHMIMIMELENVFELKFESEEIIEMTTIKKIDDIIRKKLS